YGGEGQMTKAGPLPTGRGWTADRQVVEAAPLEADSASRSWSSPSATIIWLPANASQRLHPWTTQEGSHARAGENGSEWRSPACNGGSRRTGRRDYLAGNGGHGIDAVVAGAADQ